MKSHHSQLLAILVIGGVVGLIAYEITGTLWAAAIAGLVVGWLL